MISEYFYILKAVPDIVIQKILSDFGVSLKGILTVVSLCFTDEVIIKLEQHRHYHCLVVVFHTGVGCTV